MLVQKGRGDLPKSLTTPDKVTKFTFNVTTKHHRSLQITARPTQGQVSCLGAPLAMLGPACVSLPQEEPTAFPVTIHLPFSQLPDTSEWQMEQKTGRLPCLGAPLGPSAPLSLRLPSGVKASHRHHQELPPSSSCLFWPPKLKSGVLLFTVVAASPPILAAI